VIGLIQRSSRKLACQQAVELVTDYLEGALTRAQRRRFEAHLRSCADCPEYLAQMRVIIALTGSITTGDLSSSMRDELAGLYRRWKDDELRGALARAADAGHDGGAAPRISSWSGGGQLGPGQAGAGAVLTSQTAPVSSPVRWASRPAADCPGVIRVPSA
jgi:anti-sigma factor RsiW